MRLEHLVEFHDETIILIWFSTERLTSNPDLLVVNEDQLIVLLAK